MVMAALPIFRLTFLGAAGTVTGSKYLVETNKQRLLVDCGLFQGYKPLRLRNWAPLPVDAKTIDAVMLTHAHLDHTGYLPRLVRDGFRGDIWCTPSTYELCKLLLLDSGRLQEEEAGYATRKGYSKHRPALPLYTEDDARHALWQFRTVAFGEPFEPVQGITAALHPQGHILGAGYVRLEHGDASITFSGDLGRPNDALMLPPSALQPTDWIVTESTYGNRKHPAEDLKTELKGVINRVAARGGVIVVPAFAVGRTQLLLHRIAQLKQEGAIPALPVFLDSPMAADATQLYRLFCKEHRLTAEECRRMFQVASFTNTVEQSKAISARHGPMIVISASGMATGGRVLHHLRACAPDKRNAIVLAGFQAGGTRGAALAAGATSLRIHGQDVPVNAEVVQLTSSSAHADANEILAWLRTAPHPPRKVFITHGELDAADALRQRIEHELGWAAEIPEYRGSVDLCARTPQ